MKKIKWAQMSDLERAYQRAMGAERADFSSVRKRDRSLESKEYKRARNRYYQLLGHWCKLKKSNEAVKSSDEI